MKSRGSSEFGVRMLARLEIVDSRSRTLDHILESDRHAHAAADAQGSNPFSRIAFQHFVQERDRDARAGAADGMAESNGASVHVETVAIEIQNTVAGEHLGGEGFVEFDQAEFMQAQGMLVCELLERGNWPDPHGAWIDSG